jgi:hypothetical protein
MEFVGPTFIVFAILIIVAVAAVSYTPAAPYDAWLKLTQRYQTDRRPTVVQFTNQVLMFGEKRVKRVNDFARFDTTIDDFGLWIVFRNNDQQEIPNALKIPGTHVRYEAHHGDQYLFQLYGEPPIRMTAKGEFGETLMKKVQGEA